MKNIRLFVTCFLLSVCCSAVCKAEEIIFPHKKEWQGNQILHFNSSNKKYKEKTTLDFIKQNFKDSKPIDSDAGILRYASNQVAIDGLFLEFGVCTGKTINFIAALNPKKTIYGFDSFKGLPEDWDQGPNTNGKRKIFKKGTFAFVDENKLPNFLHNVKIYKGLFKDVLPEYKKNNKNKAIAFMHIDSDLYSSVLKQFLII